MQNCRVAYNIFVTANISPAQEQLARLFSLIGQPARIQILFALAQGDACVCHLETLLGMRQAAISQHLMLLRNAGLVETRREGRNIFYRLSQPESLEILRGAARVSAMDLSTLENLPAVPLPGCPCPYCNPGLDPDLSCKTVRDRHQN